MPFIVWGILKLRGGEAKLVPGLQALGIPDAVFCAYLVGVCELVGGMAVILGYPVRTASVLLGFWCLLTGYDAHRNNITELMKNLTMAGASSPWLQLVQAQFLFLVTLQAACLAIRAIPARGR